MLEVVALLVLVIILLSAVALGRIWTYSRQQVDLLEAIKELLARQK
jgi:hypothetical protein